MRVMTKTSRETRALGKKMGSSLIRSGPKDMKALVVAFFGNLGAGKTTFLAGFAKGLGVKEHIVSPTFVIMKRFPLRKGFYKNFYHIDCYRLQDPRELLALGFKKICADPHAIVAIEWSERIRNILPKDCIRVTLKAIDKNKREIRLWRKK